MKNIVLTGNQGKYFFAKKTKDGLNLESSKRFIDAGLTLPYGFSFDFGGFHKRGLEFVGI